MKKPISALYGIVIPTVFLSTLGIIMVFSASSVKSLQQSGSSIAIVGRQSIFFIVGVLLAIALARTPRKFLERISRPILMLSAIVLLLPQAPVIGKSVNGNTNWIEFAGFSLQPSEFAKFGLILWLAGALTRFENRLATGENPQFIKEVIPGILLLIALILIGKDLGTAIVFAAIAAGILFISGLPLRWFSMGLGALFLTVLFFVLIQPNRIYRIRALLDPFSEEHYQNAGWQPAHSIMGLASGGVFGSGLGAGKQKWGNLAEAHTDFIFAVIGEELGLLGTLTVLILFGFLIVSIFRVALKSETLFEKYFVAGIGIWFLVQIAINIGSVTGLMPVIGVTLPLISYGGSSLIANFAAIGIVLSVALRNPKIKEALRHRFAVTTEGN